MKDWIAKIGVIALGVVALAFVLAIITSDSKLVVTPYESTAVAASGERLIQMAQWTIGTVLTVGALLIGLNWYQNDRRYERDKQDLKDELRTLRQDAERRLGHYWDGKKCRIGSNNDGAARTTKRTCDDGRGHETRFPE
ncbi:MAG: hypothetical protein ACR2OU_15580 [Thermomicrobiales bacterium]